MGRNQLDRGQPVDGRQLAMVSPVERSSPSAEQIGDLNNHEGKARLHRAWVGDGDSWDPVLELQPCRFWIAPYLFLLAVHYCKQWEHRIDWQEQKQHKPVLARRESPGGNDAYPDEFQRRPSLQLPIAATDRWSGTSARATERSNTTVPVSAPACTSSSSTQPAFPADAARNSTSGPEGTARP